MEERCNVTCNCDMKKFSPICSAEGMTYFSSCRAGCTSSNIDNGKTQFFGCECISQSKKWLPSLYVYIQCVPTYNYFFPADIPDGAVEAVSGYCDSNCRNFLLFMSLFSFLVFIHSTSEVGSMLLIMRCTDPKGKLYYLRSVWK